MGRIPTIQNKKRSKALQDIIKVFERYKYDLGEYRLSIMESFEKNGGIALELLDGCEIKYLQSEERKLIDDSVCRMKNGSYRESTECVVQLLDRLANIVQMLKENEKTTGKALPIVTSMIGLLLAVLLF